MGFFLETLIGGPMAGMLYALVALGFVLIFRPRRVQLCAGRHGAVRSTGHGPLCRMVPVDGASQPHRGQPRCLRDSGAIMFVVAWLIESWCCATW